VGAVALHEDDIVALTTIFRAELRSEFEPPGAAAYNDDLCLETVGAVAGLFFDMYSP
jgi:hypothetical protein